MSAEQAPTQQVSSKKRLLQREVWIRFSGVLLMLSPFANLGITLAMAPAKISLALAWTALKSASFILWALWVVSFMMGHRMFTGKKASWAAVLVVLGIFIVFNVAHLRQDMRTGFFQPVSYLIINISLFAFIYALEFRRIKLKHAIEDISAVQSARPDGQPVHFEGMGPWARIFAVNRTHVAMIATGKPPEDIEHRPIEVSITRALRLRLRFVHVDRERGVYTFEFNDIDEFKQRELDRWIVRTATKHRAMSSPKAAS